MDTIVDQIINWAFAIFIVAFVVTLFVRVLIDMWKNG